MHYNVFLHHHKRVLSDEAIYKPTDLYIHLLETTISFVILRLKRTPFARTIIHIENSQRALITQATPGRL